MFDPKNDECRAFVDEYIEISKKLYGIITVGSVDCTKEGELCEDFNVLDVP